MTIAPMIPGWRPFPDVMELSDDGGGNANEDAGMDDCEKDKGA